MPGLQWKTMLCSEVVDLIWQPQWEWFHIHLHVHIVNIVVFAAGRPSGPMHLRTNIVHDWPMASIVDHDPGTSSCGNWWLSKQPSGLPTADFRHFRQHVLISVWSNTLTSPHFTIHRMTTIFGHSVDLLSRQEFPLDLLLFRNHPCSRRVWGKL